MAVQRIVVFGDSVTWGQGLLDTEKFSTIVGTRLGVPVEHITMLAHSGAVIGVGINPEVPAQPGEVPRPYPTILQQVNGFSDAPRDNRSRAHNRRHQ
jgi:hypothetical protein